jgi:serine protease Do
MSMIANVVEQVIETGVVHKGFMGVSLLEIDGQSLAMGGRSIRGFAPLAEAISEEHDGEGVAVSRVVDDSPADMAGVQVGDVIERVEGRRVRGLEQLKSMVSSYRPGTEVVLGIWRWDPDSTGGVQLDLVLVLGELSAADASPFSAEFFLRLGLRSIARSTPELASDLGVTYKRGVLVLEAVDRGALGRALPAGTTIVAIDGRAVSTVDEIHARIDRAMLASGRMRGFTRPFPLAAVLPDGQEVVIDLARMTQGRSR